MACLYSPYRRSRVAEGGFCEPVRILLTVLSAWLKTRSGGVRGVDGVGVLYVPTESAMASDAVQWMPCGAPMGSLSSFTVVQRVSKRLETVN